MNLCFDNFIHYLCAHSPLDLLRGLFIYAERLILYEPFGKRERERTFEINSSTWLAPSLNAEEAAEIAL